VRRADRLFAIVQALRGRRLTTSAQLAERLGVSARTIYRDVRDLTLSGVPIEGEAGVGYRLRPGFDLPPLMFDTTEVEALAIGVRMVGAWSSPELAAAALRAGEKLAAVLPADRRRRLENAPLYALNLSTPPDRRIDSLRAAIDARGVAEFNYSDAAGGRSRRSVWPLALTFWGGAWTLGGWCELRHAFRNFRVDRIDGLRVTERVFPDEAGRRLADFIRAMEADDPRA